MTYKEFIDNIIETRGQWNIPKGEYFEVHHITPRCLGGDGIIRKGGKIQKHPNLIYLYAREHFIAHKLLAEENKDNTKLVLAWSMMAFPKGKTNREFQITPEEYEEIRKLQSNVISKNNPFLKNGKPWNFGKHGVYSKEVLDKIRAPRPNMRGIKLSDETKKRMSKAQKNRYAKHPEKWKSNTLGKICITDEKINKYIDKTEKIPDGFRLGQKKRETYTIKDLDAYKELRRRQTAGNKNPMFGHGERVSGGKNGHAIYIYTYNGTDYQCRDELMVDLKKEFPKISESAIRRIMSGNYTKRISNKFQAIIDNLSWRLKSDEN